MSGAATGYPAVARLLAALLTGGRAALGDELVGLYLYGSLALGDFDPEASDVDFLVATRGALGEGHLAALAELHARLAASGLPYADRLEGSYIPVRALRRYDPADNRHPTIGVDWPFGVAPHGTNWVLERHILREHGRALRGPPPRELVDPVGPDDLRAAVRDLLLGFWARQLAEPAPDWLQPRAYQAFAILTMCRALHTLATDTVASKPVAAEWARRGLDPAWTPLIDRALAARHDFAPGDMGEMLRFVAWAVAQARADRGER